MAALTSPAHLWLSPRESKAGKPQRTMRGASQAHLSRLSNQIAQSPHEKTAKMAETRAFSGSGYADF